EPDARPTGTSGSAGGDGKTGTGNGARRPVPDPTQHIHDDAEARALVRRLVEHAAPGSILILSHSAPSPRLSAAAGQYAESGGLGYRLRPTSEISAYFDGLHLAEPGLVPMPDWHPDGSTTPTREDVGYGAVAHIR
ncbi:SAM-dependent methyltransferase, partial [Streptomyces sp. MNP-20]|uniref:SAM-dependent methyltransferase n=1 Tax=Streptomyces sp. MNP-20 TaxID=2721165 RepID=UPI0015581E61